MNSLTLSRCTLNVCATATLLVGCGGLQPVGVTQGPAPQGQMPQNPSSVSGVRQSPRSVRHATATETILHSFGATGDGASPEAGLTYFKGTLYGTTERGGLSCHDLEGCGTVYRITTSGTETVLHRFKGGGDGAYPLARMIVFNGTLYGTTFYRGGCRQGGCGTVFSITPSGHETVLHVFTGSPDGEGPEARLLNVNGTLYGTTSSGGAYNSVRYFGGTVFSITPGGKEKVLHSFGNGTDGAYLTAGLIDVKGALYGTTEAGGTNNNGTVFSITSGGKEKVLYSFGAHGNDGRDPSGLVDVNGTLYGTTTLGGSNVGFCASSGCGTVFSITPSGKETVLHSFSGGDGADPEAALLNVNGTLYGTTSEGGAYGLGTVFSITLSGHETVLYSFKGYGQDGENPYSGVIDVNGTLYGTTERGGGNVCYGKGCGTVFSIAL